MTIHSTAPHDRRSNPCRGASRGRVSTLGVLAAGALALAAAGPARASGEHLAVFTKNSTNPNYSAFRLGADRSAARLGASTVHRVPKIPDDASEQIALLRASVAERPDAILLAPADDKVLEPTVHDVNAAGIPIVGFVDRMANDRIVTFIGSDDREMGLRTALYLLGKMGGRGDVVIMEGTSTAPTSRDRVAGFREALARFPDIHLLASVTGRYQTPDAEAAMTKLLAEHPRIDGVLSANDSMAMGILTALRRQERTALVIGINGTPEAAKAISDGTLLASEDYSGFAMGCLAAEAAIRHLRGESVPKEIMLPIRIIERSNVAEWLVPVDQRSCPTWESAVTRR